MLFQKEHLINNDYHWPSTSPTKNQENPGRCYFDRFDGNQILFMINLFSNIIAKFSLNDGQKIETLIIHELPLDVKSEVSVFNWLRGKYLYS